MSEWKQGDKVTFTLTGTIAHINDVLATIDVHGIPHTVHISHILGTPEQAMRKQIMAIIEQEFPTVRCFPLRDNDIHFLIEFTEAFPASYQRDQTITAIQKRVAELEEKLA